MTQSLIASAAAAFAALFPIANPVGAIPIFYSLTATDMPDTVLYRGDLRNFVATTYGFTVF
ncbi:MAG: hypothetical protein ACFCU8_11850 [Thermosynechococcaceae cyanobacterium]